MRFDSQLNLLEIFKKVTLHPKKFADCELKKCANQESKYPKERKATTQGSTSPHSKGGSSSRRKMVKYYNCYGTSFFYVSTSEESEGSESPIEEHPRKLRQQKP